jgi:DNA repair photolyase
MIKNRFEYHKEIRNLFYKYLDKTITANELEKLQVTIYEDNNTQWAKQGTNIIKSSTNCPNLCRYCYVQAWKIRKDKMELPDIEDARAQFVCDDVRVEKKWMVRKNPKMFIFPSTHDIFEEMVEKYISVAKKIMDSGCEIILVSKPRMNCIKRICEELRHYKDKITMVFTISSHNNQILKKYEPFAPSYEERSECLKYAFEHGYETSISMEPLLDDPYTVINELDKYVSRCIWIGSLNHCKELKFTKEMMKKVTDTTNKEYLMNLISNLRGNPKVYWKYKIMRLVGLKGKKEVEDDDDDDDDI